MGQEPGELSPREAIVVRFADAPGYTAEPTSNEAPPRDEVAAARDDIERTRSDMTSTLEAIQDKLDPEVISEQARDTARDVTDYAIREAREAAREITDHAIVQARQAVRDATGQASLALREATIGKVEHMARTASDTASGWGDSLVETIKANPMPAALVGLGVGWMFLNRPSPRTYPPTAYSTRPYMGTAAPETGSTSTMAEAQQSVGRVVDRAQDTAAQVGDQMQSTASQVVDQVQTTGAQVMDQVQEQAANAQTFMQRQLEQNPLLIGAVGVAIGGVLAGTMRSTPREDQLLGASRDRLMGSARELTEQTMHKVGRVVDEAQTAATDSAREQSLIADPGPA